jgi:hypothetical protein
MLRGTTKFAFLVSLGSDTQRTVMAKSELTSLVMLSYDRKTEACEKDKEA